MPVPSTPDLRGKVAIVTGGSRGVGRETCLALARCGCAVVVAAKSATPQPTLPGTIHTVAAEVEALGASALAFQLDLRDETNCVACVKAVVAKFGRVDILVNNASALWWHTIAETPTKKFDLIQSINARGAFIMTRECLPHMSNGRYGRVICMGPPLPKTYKSYAGKTAYYMSKCGMTMVALGAAAEGEKMGAGTNVTGNSLWPATIVESLASTNFQRGDRKYWRKASILADCVTQLCAHVRRAGARGPDVRWIYARSLHHLCPVTPFGCTRVSRPSRPPRRQTTEKECCPCFNVVTAAVGRL